MCSKQKQETSHFILFSYFGPQAPFSGHLILFVQKFNQFSKFSVSLLFFNIKLFNLIFPEKDFSERVEKLFLSIIAFSIINSNDKTLYKRETLTEKIDDDDGCEVWSFEFGGGRYLSHLSQRTTCPFSPQNLHYSLETPPPHHHHHHC